MNPTGHNILLAYLGHYEPSYVSNNNIPNPWTMIPNPYYLGNPPFTFFNTTNSTSYPFPNMVFTQNWCYIKKRSTTTNHDFFEWKFWPKTTPMSTSQKNHLVILVKCWEFKLN